MSSSVTTLKTPGYYLKRLNSIPQSVQDRFDSLLDEVAGRGLLSLTVSELCARLGVKLYSGDRPAASDALALTQLVEYCGLKLVPCYVIADIKPEYMVMLAEKPNLALDPDIKRVQELVAGKAGSLNSNDKAALDRTRIKMASYNIMLRVFEGLSLVPFTFLPSQAVDRVNEIFKNLVLPKVGERYLRSCLTFATIYGTYKVDFTNPKFHLKRLDPELEARVANYLHFIVNSFGSGGKAQKAFQGSIYEKTWQDLNIPSDKAAAKTVTDNRTFLQSSKAREAAKKSDANQEIVAAKIEALITGALNSGVKLPYKWVKTLKDELILNKKTFTRDPNFPLVTEFLPYPKLLKETVLDENTHLIAAFTSSPCVHNFPVLLVNEQKKVSFLSEITSNDLKSNVYSRLVEKLNRNYIDRFPSGYKIEQGFLYYLVFVLLYQNALKGVTNYSKARCSNMLATLASRNFFLEFPEMAVIAGLYFIFFDMDFKKHDLGLPDYMFQVLDASPFLFEIIEEIIVQEYDISDISKLPVLFKEIFLLDLLSSHSDLITANTLAKQGVHIQNFASLNLTVPVIARTLMNLFEPLLLKPGNGLYYTRELPKSVSRGFSLNCNEYSASSIERVFSRFPNLNTLFKNKFFKAVFFNLMFLAKKGHFSDGKVLCLHAKGSINRDLISFLRGDGMTAFYISNIGDFKPDLAHIFSPKTLSAEKSHAIQHIKNLSGCSFGIIEQKLLLKLVIPGLRFPILQKIASCCNMQILPLFLGPLSFYSKYKFLKIEFVKLPDVKDNVPPSWLITAQFNIFALHLLFPLKSFKSSFFKDNWNYFFTVPYQAHFDDCLNALINIADNLRQLLEFLSPDIILTDLYRSRLVNLDSLKQAWTRLFSLLKTNQDLKSRLSAAENLISLIKAASSTWQAVGYPDDFIIAYQNDILAGFDALTLARIIKNLYENGLYQEYLPCAPDIKLTELFVKLERSHDTLKEVMEVLSTLPEFSSLTGGDAFSFFAKWLETLNLREPCFGLAEILKHLGRCRRKKSKSPRQSANTPKLSSQAYDFKNYIFDKEKINSKIKESIEIRDVIGHIRDEADTATGLDTGSALESLLNQGTVTEGSDIKSAASGSEINHKAAITAAVAMDPGTNHKAASPVISAAEQTFFDIKDTDLPEPLAKLNSNCLKLLKALIATNASAMDLHEFESLCQDCRFMSGLVAVEMLNEWSFEVFDESLVEYDSDENLVYLYEDLLEKIKNLDF